MTNAQLYLAIGLPSLILLVNVLQVHGIRDELREIRKDLVGIHERVAKIEVRLDEIEKHLGPVLVKP